MRTKCGEPCEKYSRVCGYFRPVNNWNRGKKEEFRERKLYNWPGPGGQSSYALRNSGGQGGGKKE